MARVGVAEEHLRHNNTANDFAQAGLYEYLEKRMRESDANFGIKPCPRCKRPVEKNGACSHMQCGAAAHGNASQAIARGLGCGAHFCWTCGWVPAATTQQCRSVREGGGRHWTALLLHRRPNQTESPEFAATADGSEMTGGRTRAVPARVSPRASTLSTRKE